MMYKRDHEEKEREATLIRFQRAAEDKKKEYRLAYRRRYEDKLILPING
jgi:hypothetical protein